LGSTSIVTDASGNVISQTKYKAWGEVRYSSGSEMTKYQYTSQYSYAGEFGLLYFNARWVDPSLGRFAQADTIVPPGVQGLDRYAYTGNDPVNHTDPSGHCRMDAKADDCLKADRSNALTLVEALKEFGVTANGVSVAQQKEALAAADNFGRYYYNEYGSQYGFSSAEDAFKKLTGGNISIVQDDSRNNCITDSSVITCDADSMTMKAFVHEYFHVFDKYYQSKTPLTCPIGFTNGSSCLASNFQDSKYYTDPDYAVGAYKCSNLTVLDQIACTSHPYGLGEYDFAESFANAGENLVLGSLDINLAHNGFADNAYGQEVQGWISGSMTGFLNVILGGTP